MKAAFSIAPFAAALLIAANPAFSQSDDEFDQAMAELGWVNGPANVNGQFKLIGARAIALFAFLSRSVTRKFKRRDA